MKAPNIAPRRPAEKTCPKDTIGMARDDAIAVATNPIAWVSNPSMRTIRKQTTMMVVR